MAPPIHSLELKKVIRIFIDEIRKTYRLDSAYLFGSHAKGTSNQWSDIDLVVALALTFHGGAGEFGDRRDTGEITYGGISVYLDVCAFLHGGGLAMKAERYLDEEATIKKGVDALVRELGPVEAMRFLSLPRERRQESVKRHREWQKKLDKKVFFNEVFG